MQTGMYLNSLICFSIFGFGFFSASYIYKNNKNNFVDVSYAVFLLLVSLTWLLFGVSLVLFKIGKINASLFLNQYFVQTTAFLEMAAVSYYAFFRLTKNKVLSLVAFFLFILGSLAGLYYHYQPGSIYLTRSTYYSFEYGIDETYFKIFQTLFAIILFVIALDFLRNLYYWFKRSSLFEQRYFFASFALLIYSLIGYLEESSMTATWISLLFRLAIVLCTYTAYLAYSEQET